MKPQPEISASNFTVKVGPQELGQIINIRKNLDHVAVLARFAAHYEKIGWPLVALNSQTEDDLGIDFTLPQGTWAEQLMDVSLRGIQVHLAVRTGAASQLFVLKVKGDYGENVLNSLDSWRSHCLARPGNQWEHHFFLLPKNWQIPSFHVPDSKDSHLVIIGEGGLASVPPSMDSRTEDISRWLNSPWEHPPCYPTEALAKFFAKIGLISKENLAGRPDLPSWQETHRIISRHDRLLRALLAPRASLAAYYQEIIKEALMAGCIEPRMLKALLWHAPHSEARHNPARWTGLLNLVDGIQEVLLNGKSDHMASLAPDKFDSGAKFSSPAHALAPKVPPAAQQSGLEGVSRENLLDRFERLTARTLELERQLGFLKSAAESSSPPGKAMKYQLEKGPDVAIPLWDEWLTLIHRSSPDDHEVEKLKEAVAAFLKENRDLSINQERIQLVLYCFHNYIKINPGFTGLSYRDKLSRAGEIARNFLASQDFYNR